MIQITQTVMKLRNFHYSLNRIDNRIFKMNL